MVTYNIAHTLVHSPLPRRENEFPRFRCGRNRKYVRCLCWRTARKKEGGERGKKKEKREGEREGGREREREREKEKEVTLDSRRFIAAFFRQRIQRRLISNSARNHQHKSPCELFGRYHSCFEGCSAQYMQNTVLSFVLVKNTSSKRRDKGKKKKSRFHILIQRKRDRDITNLYI